MDVQHRFARSGHKPAWGLLTAHRAGRAEDLSRDRLRLREAVHRVRERGGIAVRETTGRRRAYRRRRSVPL